jgi:uncharacterized protein
MSHIHSSVLQLKKMLLHLDAWLDKAVVYANAKAFDPVVLVGARLAPDQYPLARQVQSACDTAKFAAARLAGKEAPKHPDTEQTIAELRARIQTTTGYLGTFKPTDFDGAESRLVALPYLEGKVLTGDDYLMEQVLPNFYFHVTTAYAILRHNGVGVGKRDFIGSLSARDR